MMTPDSISNAIPTQYHSHNYTLKESPTRTPFRQGGRGSRQLLSSDSKLNNNDAVSWVLCTANPICFAKAISPSDNGSVLIQPLRPHNHNPNILTLCKELKLAKSEDLHHVEMERDIAGWRIKSDFPHKRKLMQSFPDGFPLSSTNATIIEKENWDDMISLESSEFDDQGSHDSSLFPYLNASGVPATAVGLAKNAHIDSKKDSMTTVALSIKCNKKVPLWEETFDLTSNIRSGSACINSTSNCTQRIMLSADSKESSTPSPVSIAFANTAGDYSTGSVPSSSFPSSSLLSSSLLSSSKPSNTPAVAQKVSTVFQLQQYKNSKYSSNYIDRTNRLVTSGRPPLASNSPSNPLYANINPHRLKRRHVNIDQLIDSTSISLTGKKRQAVVASVASAPVANDTNGLDNFVEICAIVSTKDLDIEAIAAIDDRSGILAATDSGVTNDLNIENSGIPPSNTTACITATNVATSSTDDNSSSCSSSNSSTADSSSSGKSKSNRSISSRSSRGSSANSGSSGSSGRSSNSRTSPRAARSASSTWSQRNAIFGTWPTKSQSAATGSWKC